MTKPTSSRLPAIDILRGIVMLLMSIDHASDAFNAGRLFTDSAHFYRAGMALPAAQFFTRWVTHLCAPTFVFLAGTGLAFSIAKERRNGKSELAIDAFIAARGVVIWAFELWISFFVMPKGMFVFQVLYAIGASYLAMVALRRLPPRVALGLAIAFILGAEALVAALGGPFAKPASPLAALLLLGGNPASLIVAYPMLHWLALMLLGWVYGHHLQRPAARHHARETLLAGLGLLAVFALVRGLNAYGNMQLPRDDGSLVQWLHVSKYPPSLSYDCLELGLMALTLSLCFRVYGKRAPHPENLLLVLGQTPLFFYVLHFPILVVAAHRLLGHDHRLGLGATFIAAATVVALLYPACRWYRGYKVAHPRSVARFV